MTRRHIKDTKKIKYKFVPKTFLKRITITLLFLSLTVGVGLEIKGLTVIAANPRTHLNVTDSHGNLDWKNKWMNILGEGVKEGWNSLRGNFAKWGNHNGDGYGSSYNTLHSWQKQRSKLSKSQLHGVLGYTGQSVDQQGLYAYGKSVGLDRKDYKNDRAYLNAVTKKVKQKSDSVDRAGERLSNQWGAMDRQSKEESKAWDNYKANLSKVKNELSKSANTKINTYLKKHDIDPSIKDDKYFKTLKAALEKYATGEAKKDLGSATKEFQNEYKKSAQGEEETSTDDVKQMLEKGQMPEPTTLWGKIGRALMNAFWASSIGSWLENNGVGASIFAGTTDVSTLANQIKSNPLTLIYPISSDYSSMSIVSAWLQPAMIALGGALITLTLVVSTMRMGWGQSLDPVRSRLNWYQNIIDTIIAVVMVAAFPAFVTMVLQLNGDILLAFANFMTSVTPQGATETIFQTALKLGFDKTTINAISTGMLLGGSDFAGVIFEIIYLLVFVGLAIYIKYFYFMRTIAFTVLISIGPVFMALWTFNWGKGRTFAWLKDFIGTVFIQCIHALTLTFMAMFMDWNNGRITGETTQQIANMINWQKANPGKQFLNSITLGIAGYGPSQTSNGASVFEVLVVGFIIMILFQPLSKSLAELFGISTNMLDNIHGSTSRTLKAAALLGGTALTMGVAAPLKLGSGLAGGAIGATKDGIKSAAKDAKTFKDFRSNLAKGFGKNFRRSYVKRKPFRKTLAHINGIVGPGAGRLMGLAVGAGADDPEAMLALSKAGGAIGERAARLTNKPLSSLGLGRIWKLGKRFSTKPDGSLAAVDKANRKTENSLVKGSSVIRDVENGQLAGADEGLNIKINQAKENYKNGNISREQRDKIIDNSIDLQKKLHNAKHGKELLNDPAIKSKIAVADARRKASGTFSQASSVARVTRKALGSEISKLEGANGEADAIQCSLALAGAASSGAAMIRVDEGGINKAVEEAQTAYATAHAEDFVRNGFTNKKEWLDSNQYRQGEANAIKQAKQQFVSQTNGTIYSMPDQLSNSAFGNSMVNKDIYKDELSKAMSNANISPEVQQRAIKAIDSVKGESLITDTPLDGSTASLKTINYDLNNQLAGQDAYTLNNSAFSSPSDRKISAYDIAQTYHQPSTNPTVDIGGSATDDFSPEAFKGYMDRSNAMQRYKSINRHMVAAYADYQRTQADLNNSFDAASSGTNPYSLGNWVRGSGHSSAGLGTAKRNINPNEMVAAERITAFNQDWGPSGMTPEEAIESLTSNIENSSNKEATDNSRIPAGSLQLVTDNTASYVRAKMPDGNFHLVGNYGIGEPSLEGTESIIQNLDVSPAGFIGPRFDSNTHRIEAPYTQVGDLKIPRVYTGNGPDLSRMLGEYAAPQQTQSGDVSDYHTMGAAPELERAQTTDYNLTLDKISNNYSDYAYYSDGREGVIVGKDKRDGLFKQISPLRNEGILDTSITDQQYSIPLMDSGNGLIPDINGEPQIFSKNQIGASPKRELMDSLWQHMDSSSSRQKFNSYLNDMLAPTEENVHNYTANHPANLGIHGLGITNY